MDRFIYDLGDLKCPFLLQKIKYSKLGKAVTLNEGTDVSIFCTGHLVWKSIEAAQELEERGYSVEIINIHTIKPLDDAAILKSVAKTKCVVTAEEHQMNGGLGDSVCQLLAREMPTPVEMVAVNDRFGESGTPAELMTKYGIDTDDVIAAAERAMARK